MVDFSHWTENWRIKCFWLIHRFYLSIHKSLCFQSEPILPNPLYHRRLTDSLQGGNFTRWCCFQQSAPCLLIYLSCHPPLLHANKLAVSTSPAIHMTWRLCMNYFLEGAYILWSICQNKLSHSNVAQRQHPPPNNQRLVHTVYKSIS